MSHRSFSLRAALSVLTAAALSTSVGCIPVEEEPEESTESTEQAMESAGPIARAFVTGVGAVNTLSEPMASYAELASAHGGGDAKQPSEGDLETERQVQGDLENSMAQTGFVTDPACIAYSFSGLTMTIDFDQCVVASTGELLDGSTMLGVGLSPISLNLGFETLQIGDAAFDGSLGFALAYDPALGYVFETQATLSYENDEDAVSVTISDLDVQLASTGALTSGALDVDTAETSADVAFASVHWATGQCLPSSGSLSYDDGGVPVTITFLPTTPMDGVVSVQVGGLPAQDLAVFPPCA